MSEAKFLKRSKFFQHDGEPCKLIDCPPGLFAFGDNIGFKSEYGCENAAYMEVYCVDSGEIFWGGTDNKDQRAALVVQPLNVIAWNDGPAPELPNPTCEALPLSTASTSSECVTKAVVSSLSELREGNGWILAPRKWTGNPDQQIQVLIDSGRMLVGNARTFDWTRTEGEGRITHYRLIASNCERGITFVKNKQTVSPVFLVEELEIAQDPADQHRLQKGFVVLEPWNGMNFMRMLYVHEEYRRQGVAGRLIERSKEISTAGLAVRPTSWADEPVATDSLIRAYKRHDFVPMVDYEGVLVWKRHDAS